MLVFFFPKRVCALHDSIIIHTNSESIMKNGLKNNHDINNNITLNRAQNCNQYSHKRSQLSLLCKWKIHVSSKIAARLVCNHTLSSDLLIKICNELIPLRLNLSSSRSALVNFEPCRVRKTTGLLLLDVK